MMARFGIECEDVADRRCIEAGGFGQYELQPDVGTVMNSRLRIGVLTSWR